MQSFLSQLQKGATSFIGTNIIAVDIGTAITRIAIFEKGVVIREPSYVGLNTKTNEYVFFGGEAKEIYGKAPNFIQIIHPMDFGIISDFDSTVKLIEHFFEKAVHPFFFKNKLLKTKFIAYTTIPSNATEVEERALEEALIKAGAGRVRIL